MPVGPVFLEGVEMGERFVGDRKPECRADGLPPVLGLPLDEALGGDIGPHGVVVAGVSLPWPRRGRAIVR